MAVVKANFVKSGRGERASAKAHIKYIQHRHGKNKEKMIRTLFGREGSLERSDAYRMIDEAGKKDNLFRFVISPDPNKEDNEKDLNMREITQSVMLKIEEILGKPVLVLVKGWVVAMLSAKRNARGSDPSLRPPLTSTPVGGQLDLRSAPKGWSCLPVPPMGWVSLKSYILSGLQLQSCSERF